MTFEDWLKDNQQELIDFYYEGTCIDKDMLTAIEQFARKAFEAGWDKGWSTGASYIEWLYT